MGARRYEVVETKGTFYEGANISRSHPRTGKPIEDLPLPFMVVESTTRSSRKRLAIAFAPNEPSANLIAMAMENLDK